MPQDQMFNEIYGKAQEYMNQVKGNLPAAPVAPQISQDISGLQGINASLAQGDYSQGMAKGMEGEAKYQWAKEEEARARAEAAKKAAKPKRVPKEDGGFDFFDADGNKISAYDFARLEETDISSVLKDSMNPEDQKFISDYSGLRDFWDAGQKLGDMGSVNVDKFKIGENDNGDQVLLDENDAEIKEKDPRFTYWSWLQDNPEMKKMKLADTRDAFMKKWGAVYYGMNTEKYR